MGSEKLLLRVMEAASLLSIGRSQMYKLLSTGQVPVVRVGKSVRVPLDALQQWVVKNTQSTDDAQTLIEADSLEAND